MMSSSMEIRQKGKQCQIYCAFITSTFDYHIILEIMPKKTVKYQVL